uniref:Uncharacterized protein n=1 Tax=Cannabis sativa TaxID=3483 RepID=A0A803QLT8_CANSA
MARLVVRDVVLVATALVLSVVLMMFPVVQGRRLCGGGPPLAMVDSTTTAHYFVQNVIDLWGIKSSGPSSSGGGH